MPFYTSAVRASFIDKNYLFGMLNARLYKENKNV